MTKPYYQDEWVTIYHGDCREILPQLDVKVDLVLTDPPYGVNYVTSWRSRNDSLRVPIANDESLNTLRDIVGNLDISLNEDRHIYLFAAPQRIGEAIDIISPYWVTKNILVWDKGDAGTVGDLECGYAWNWEPIIYASKGRRKLNGKRPRAIYRYDWSGTRDPVHPTVKPVGLLKWLILKSSEKDEVILDCYMGSGTTLFAAKQLSRKCIGIEIEEKYCEIAAKRCSQSVMKLDC